MNEIQQTVLKLEDYRRLAFLTKQERELECKERDGGANGRSSCAEEHTACDQKSVFQNSKRIYTHCNLTIAKR